MCLTHIIKRKPGQTEMLFNVFETLDIEFYKKAILQDRYLVVLRNMQYRANLYSFMFFSMRITVSVGSILVPAFLSIQGNPIRDSVYLAAWVISILVTICNGFITLFRIDKKYYYIHMTLELLHSEGWRYVGLNGHYWPKDAPIPPTHDSQFQLFAHTIEKIKLRQVEEEYWKLRDTTATGTAKSDRPLEIAETPITQQGPLSLLPAEQKTAIEGWIKAMRRTSLSKSINGLMPRIGINTTPRIDGASNPRIRRSTSHTSVPVQSEVSDASSPQDAMVSTAFPLNTIYEDTFNKDEQSVSNEPDK